MSRRKSAPPSPHASQFLVVDVGGTHVKLYTSEGAPALEFGSGPEMTPADLVRGIHRLVPSRSYQGISIGYPGLVVRGRIAVEPKNLGPGWIGFDFAKALGAQVKLINDAAMQALGSYQDKKMLFLGLGTGLGTCLVIDGLVVPMELAHLPYRKGKSFEEYVGVRGLERLGKRRWRKHVEVVIELLRAALEPEEVVLGGGNIHKLNELPEGVRLGSNEHAHLGGLRLWVRGGPQ